VCGTRGWLVGGLVGWLVSGLVGGLVGGLSTSHFPLLLPSFRGKVVEEGEGVVAHLAMRFVETERDNFASSFLDGLARKQAAVEEAKVEYNTTYDSRLAEWWRLSETLLPMKCSHGSA